MSVKFPVYGRDKDLWMLVIESEEKTNSRLELIDIKNKEYTGWDSNGKPVEFFIDDNKIKIRCLSDKGKPAELRQAILSFARRARPKEIFSYDGDDIQHLFKAAEEHVREGKFLVRVFKKIKNFLGMSS